MSKHKEDFLSQSNMVMELTMGCIKRLEILHGIYSREDVRREVGKNLEGLYEKINKEKNTQEYPKEMESRITHINEIKKLSNFLLENTEVFSSVVVLGHTIHHDYSENIAVKTVGSYYSCLGIVTKVFNSELLSDYDEDDMESSIV